MYLTVVFFLRTCINIVVNGCIWKQLKCEISDLTFQELFFHEYSVIFLDFNHIGHFGTHTEEKRKNVKTFVKSPLKT